MYDLNDVIIRCVSVCVLSLCLETIFRVPFLTDFPPCSYFRKYKGSRRVKKRGDVVGDVFYRIRP